MTHHHHQSYHAEDGEEPYWYDFVEHHAHDTDHVHLILHRGLPASVHSPCVDDACSHRALDEPDQGGTP